MTPQRLGERWEMGVDDIADNIDVDSEVLMNENVVEASDLRPGDLRVGVGDLHREVVCSFADDLQVALDRILGHVHDVTITVESGDIPTASLDSHQNIGNALAGVNGSQRDRVDEG